jgi:hypothetical protein
MKATKITFDALCGLLGAQDLDGILREIEREAAGGAYEEARNRGASDEDAARIAVEAAGVVGHRAAGIIRDAVIQVARTLFREHWILLVDLEDGWSWDVRPEKTWAAAASMLVATINAYGMLEFRDAKELASVCSPSTMREAVLDHLGWIAYWPEIYTSQSSEILVHDAVGAALRHL